MSLKLSQIGIAPSAPVSTDTIIGVGGGISDYQFTLAQIQAAITSPSSPQGRLTLQSGVPVQNADQTAKTTVYYDSYNGNQCPVWNGTIWQTLTIASDEISMGLATANVLSGSLYDIFAINNSGNLLLVVGPAWSSTTARGTGAGTTELQRKNGFWTNKNSLTHAWGGAAGATDYGPISANQATYLGSLYATGNGQTGVALKPAAASGGSNTIVGLFNAYNAVEAEAQSQDSTNGWSYNATAWRGANNSASNRVTFVSGLASAIISAVYSVFVIPSASAVYGGIGINLDSITANPVNSAFSGAASTTDGHTPLIQEAFYPVLGLHYVQAMEVCISTTAVSFGSSSASAPVRNIQALTARLWI
jgi:hypothetical protein